MKKSQKFIIAGTTVCLAGALSLRAQDPSTTQSSREKHESKASERSESGKHSSDTRFLEDAAKGGMAELKVAELGIQKAQSAQVKEFAQKLQRDHQQANEKIQQLCDQKSVAKATELESEHQRMIDHLSGLSGQEFDKAFIDHMVKDHKKDVKKFEKESERGDDPAIRSFASETVPTLKEHLRIAQALQENPNASIPELKEPAGAEIKSDQQQNQQQGSQEQQNQNQNQNQGQNSGQSQPQQDQSQPKSNP